MIIHTCDNKYNTYIKPLFQLVYPFLSVYAQSFRKLPCNSVCTRCLLSACSSCGRISHNVYKPAMFINKPGCTVTQIFTTKAQCILLIRQKQPLANTVTLSYMFVLPHKLVLFLSLYSVRLMCENVIEYIMYFVIMMFCNVKIMNQYN